jgi:molybdate transport repressor ModE-like protein
MPCPFGCPIRIIDMRFDLTDLRLFAEICRTGSISRGAKTSHMAVASASERVSGMEALLGVKLLQRDSRGVALTDAGRTLLSHARTITEQFERMRGELRTFSTGLKGHIKLCSNTGSAAVLVPLALCEFLRKHPNVNVHLDERTSADVVTEVTKGRADLGFVNGNVALNDLEFRPLAEDRLGVLVSRRNLLAEQKSVRFQDILDEQFIVPRNSALHQRLAQEAERLGKRLEHRVQLDSFESLVPFVEADTGIAICSSGIASKLGRHNLTFVPLANSWARRELLVCALRFDQISAHAQLFVSEVELQARLSREAVSNPDNLNPSPTSSGAAKSKRRQRSAKGI